MEEFHHIHLQFNAIDNNEDAVFKKTKSNNYNSCSTRLRLLSPSGERVGPSAPWVLHVLISAYAYIFIQSGPHFIFSWKVHVMSYSNTAQGFSWITSFKSLRHHNHDYIRCPLLVMYLLLSVLKGRLICRPESVVIFCKISYTRSDF